MLEYEGPGASGMWWAGAVVGANYTGLGGPQESTWGCILSLSKEVTYVFKDTILADE